MNAPTICPAPLIPYARVSAADVAAEVAAFRATAGLAGERAFTAIVSLRLAVSLEGKLSDLGLVDVERQTLLPTVIEPA